MDWLSSVSKCPEVLVRGVLPPWVLVGVLLCAAAVVLEVVHRRCWSRYELRGWYLFHLERYQGAERHFLKLARWSYGSRRAGALAVVGLCRLHRGEYAEAVAALAPLMGRRLPRSMRGIQNRLPGHLALCLTLLGDTARAKRCLVEGYRRNARGSSSLVLPEVAILCRQGRFGAAFRKLEDSWSVLRSEGRLCERLQMFRVYAWRGLNPGHDLYERTEELVWFTPFSGRELAFCEAHWPALAEFMREADECAARFRRELSERWSRQYEAVLNGTSPDDTSG